MYSEEDIIRQAMENGADGVCLKEHKRSVLVDAMVKTAQGERPIFTDSYGSDSAPAKE
jgi:DNA-binding NarL/FixJ family response regulator